MAQNLASNFHLSTVVSDHEILIPTGWYPSRKSSCHEDGRETDRDPNKYAPTAIRFCLAKPSAASLSNA